jgi:hypothetical protein
MILKLFGQYFNPFNISRIYQDGNNVWVILANASFEVTNANVHDVASQINTQVKRWETVTLEDFGVSE